MRLTYKYRLKPTKPQIATFQRFLELTRRQYNFRLGQRFDGYEATRSRVDACPLAIAIEPVEEIYKNIPLTRTLTKGKHKGEMVSNIGEKGYVDWLSVQRADLKPTKVLFPEYKELDAQVLQNVINTGQWLPNGQAAKSGLNKSLLDATHGQFVQVLKFVAWKLGKGVQDIDPRGTSQHCWNCLAEVAKQLSDRWHCCPCGESLHRDENSAKLIKKIGLMGRTVGMVPASLKTALNLQLAGREKPALYG